MRKSERIQQLECDLAAQKNYTVSVEQQRDRLEKENEQLKVGLEKIAGLCFEVLEDITVVLATAKGGGGGGAKGVEDACQT